MQKKNVSKIRKQNFTSEAISKRIECFSRTFCLTQTKEKFKSIMQKIEEKKKRKGKKKKTLLFTTLLYRASQVSNFLSKPFCTNISFSATVTKRKKNFFH